MTHPRTHSLFLYVSSAYRCPENSHYELCGSACPLTCMGLGSPVNCTIPCVETCTCDPGFVRSGSECVPSSQCGCSFNGHYVPAGEAFGQMMLVSGFVIAPWREDIWNAKTKAVGKESTARWKMALGTVILSPKAPVWHWVTPTTTPLTGSTLISRYYSVNTRELQFL